MDQRIMRIVLQGALHLLPRKKTWIRGQAACDAYGGSCQPFSSSARRWCAEGAIERSARELGFDRHEANDFVEEIALVVTGDRLGLAVMNDDGDYRRGQAADARGARAPRWV